MEGKGSVLFASGRKDWGTPLDFFAGLEDEFEFDIDVAASHENHLCGTYITEEVDAFKTPWVPGGTGQPVAYCNPSYGRSVGLWPARAIQQAEQEGVTTAMLLPARTDTKWWFKYATKADEIRFVVGRLRFVGAPASAPFPSVVLVFRPPGQQIYQPVGPRIRYLDRKGKIIG